MTDRELLEQAAKAAGLTLRRWNTMYASYEIAGVSPVAPTGLWNALLNDGDALRLAVKLGLTVDVRPLAVCIRRGRKRFSSFGMIEGESDLCGASRRAIVRAAAAIAQSR